MKNVFFTHRLGLDESLEEYAKRHGVRCSEARTNWRACAISLLLPFTTNPYKLVGKYTLCRIAPGVHMTTSNGPTEIVDE